MFKKLNKNAFLSYKDIIQSLQALFDFSAQPNGVKSAVWNEISKVIDSYVISPKT
jgi:hypothetical protein